MNTRLLFIFILIIALMLSACSADDLAGLEKASTPQLQMGGEGEVNQSGKSGETTAMDQIETLIGEGGSNVNSQGTPANGDNGSINPSGRPSVVAPTDQASQSGLEPSSSTDSASGGAEQAMSVNTLTYIDEPFKFSINYPDSYAILPEVDLQSQNVSADLVHQVRFLDRILAESDTAALQQPNFTVEVFTNSSQTPLDVFIKSIMPFSNMTIEPYTNGKLTGLRASTNRALAPNEFFFFAGNGMVYKLTPLGPYSTEMLQSFAILP